MDSPTTLIALIATASGGVLIGSGVAILIGVALLLSGVALALVPLPLVLKDCPCAYCITRRALVRLQDSTRLGWQDGLPPQAP